MYDVKAKYTKTNRMRTLHINAESVDACREILLADGYVEPITIEETPPELASEPQKNYARGLHLNFPSDITRSDMSWLLSKSEDEDADPEPDLMAFAEDRGMNPSKYIGKRALYRKIFHELPIYDRIAFFIFRVYAHCSEDPSQNLDAHLHKDTFYTMADGLLHNSSFVQSLKRYDGSDLVFFGEETFIDKHSMYSIGGGSVETIAYKTAFQRLSAVFPIKNKITRTHESEPFDFSGLISGSTRSARNHDGASVDDASAKHHRSPKHPLVGACFIIIAILSIILQLTESSGNLSFGLASATILLIIGIVLTLV